MTRAVFVLAVTSALVACEGREISVFEVPALVGGAGQAGSSSASDSLQAGAGGSSSGAAGVAGGGAGGAQGGGGSSSGAAQTYGGAGNGLPPMPIPCGSTMDCQPGWVCDKRGCDATLGECVPRSIFCDSAPRPVCGCDGITYWNDCIRLQSENPIPSAGPDQCRATACTCEVGADCNVPYASCSHLLPPGEMCGHGMGSCWVLPQQCDSGADPKRWRECKPPPPGVAPRCVDTCTAIATEHSYAELHRGETCD